MASADSRTVVPRRSALSRMVRAVTSPYYRYRHAKVLHSLRVGLAMLASILATTGIDIPHGIWSSVTLLVVIGGLQQPDGRAEQRPRRALGRFLADIAVMLQPADHDQQRDRRPDAVWNVDAGGRENRHQHGKTDAQAVEHLGVPVAIVR